MKFEFNKYYDNYKRYGFSNIINRLFKKIGLSLRLRDSIQNKRVYLAKKINEITGGKVIDGLYKGTKFIYSSDFFLAKPAQLIGCYEKEVQQKISDLSKNKNLCNFISVGAGEGYHAVGSRVANLFKYSFCFEMEDKNKSIIKKNFELNLIYEKFDIKGIADLNFLNDIKNKIDLSKSLFLFDIEGDEFKLLNQENLKVMQNSCLIIELHHFYGTKKQNQELIDRLKNIFNIIYINTGSRQFSNLKVLNKFSDDEKWLMMSESRPTTMSWIICEPK